MAGRGQLQVGRVRTAMAHLFEVALGAEMQIATAPDQLTQPCLLIGMPDIDYNLAAARGLDSAEFPVYLVLPRTHDQAAVDLADEIISGSGPRSVVQILQDTITTTGALGGACQTLAVPRSEATSYLHSTGDCPAYRFTVEVYG